MLLVWQTIVKKSIETSVLVKLSDLEEIPMKAAKLTEHPSFRLMRQTDVQNVWHMQMPRWLFSDPHYADSGVCFLQIIWNCFIVAVPDAAPAQQTLPLFDIDDPILPSPII